MPANLIKGKSVAEKIEAEVKKRVLKLNKKGIKVNLDVILVGNNLASETYVKRKSEAALRVGIEFKLHKFPASISKAELISNIKNIQKRTDGILIQLPLPEKLYSAEVLNAIDPNKDVDCLTHDNLGRLVLQSNYIAPPTPAAALTILKELNISLKGKNITLIGTGALVGKPLAIMLVNEGASVTTCNIYTRNIEKKCQGADIIITGVGKKDLVRGNMVKDGAVVIDTGFVYENGKLMGDVNFEEVSRVAGHLSPTPGGIGPVTVAQLLQNTVICAELSQEP